MGYCFCYFTRSYTLTAFYFHYPKTRAPKFSKVLFVTQYIISIAVFLVFLIKTSVIDGSIIFHADGQFWDFKEKQATILVAIMLVIYMIIFIIVGLWRCIIQDKKYKAQTIGLFIGMVILSFLPAVANYLSKTGVIGRDLHMTGWYLIMIVAWFLITIIYLNITEDRTSVMTKIMAITFTMMVTVLVLWGYIVEKKMVESYDIVKMEQSIRASENKNIQIPDLVYITYTQEAQRKTKTIISDNIDPNKTVIQFSYYNNERYTLAGFDYNFFRNDIHKTMILFVYTYIIILLLVSGGFIIFFRGAIVIPLKNLIAGMRTVNTDNDLTIQVPLRSNDELSYLTTNFNAMVRTLESNRKALKDYSNNLEYKVEERTLELQAAMEELEATNDQLVIAKDKLWGEMELAKRIQTILLPKELHIPGYEVTAYMDPADEVGGDYYDVITIDNKHWFIIGDVSGHGVTSGLVMMMAQTAIRTVLNQDAQTKPSELLKNINATLSYNIKKIGENKYMTLTVFAFIESHEFLYSGLHQDIIVYRAKKHIIEIIETKGMWVGLIDDIDGMVDNNSFSLEKGDAFILYTDGITESYIEQRSTMFGVKKLAEIFLNTIDSGVDITCKRILQSLESYEKDDDVTFLIVKRIN